jgi:hypothetical protein
MYPEFDGAVDSRRVAFGSRGRRPAEAPTDFWRRRTRLAAARSGTARATLQKLRRTPTRYVRPSVS